MQRGTNGTRSPMQGALPDVKIIKEIQIKGVPSANQVSIKNGIKQTEMSVF